MKKLWKKIKSEVPKEWKVVRNVSASVGSSLIAVLTANASIPLNLPEQVVANITIALAICIFIAGKAQLKEVK